MNRPLFRARNLDPNKRIRLLVDQQDDNNNDLSNSSSKSASSNNLLVSLSSTSTNQQSTGPATPLPQRCAPQMPFLSGMEREEEAEYHLQNALEAQHRLGSAKIRAVPIPDLYEDRNSQSIYPANVELPKQLIRLQPLQLESDDPEYDMDEIDHNWFRNSVPSLCPTLTQLEYETIVDKLENASTRTLVSLDEARTLFASSTPSINNEVHITTVYEFWCKRRTARDKRLKPRLLTERDVKEEKGKYHPYVAFRRRVEKMTTRKNRKNDEQAYISMLKLRSHFEAVVKLTNLIKLRETIKASWLECALAIFQARCESKPDDEATSTAQSSISSLPTNHDRHHHARSHLKPSALMNSSHHLTNLQHQQLLSQLMRIENHKSQIATSTLANLLQTPVQSRTLTVDPQDPFQRKIKKLKTSHRKSDQTDKLTQLLSSPTTSSNPTNNLGLTSVSLNPQSIFERLSPTNGVASSAQQQQTNRRRLKDSLSGTLKQGKSQRNSSTVDLWSLVDKTSGGAILLKAQLLEAARKMQQKEELENNTNRRVILQDGSSVLSNAHENINSKLDETGTSIDDEESIDPWQFRPKIGCRYLRPIDQDQQQHVSSQRPRSFSTFYSLACSERGHLGKRRIRIGRGGRLIYDRHIEQENNDSMNENLPLSSSSMKAHLTNKPVLWYVSSRPSLTESYRLNSHLTVHNHTKALAHHYLSKSKPSSSICVGDSFYHVNSSHTPESVSAGGKYRLATSVELDHPYSCSSRYVNQALRTLVEPQLPSPSPSPSPTLLSNDPLSSSQQLTLISAPPTPPPSSSSLINNDKVDISQTQQQSSYIKSSSPTSYVLPSTTSFFQANHHSHVIPSTSSHSTPSSCALIQFVQLHRILPTAKAHNFASSTPVTTSDS